MGITIKKKTDDPKPKGTPAKVTGGLSIEGEKKYIPEKKVTGAKSFGAEGKPDSTSPERRAQNLAIVRARVNNESKGMAESGKHKGKEYHAGTPGEKGKLTSNLKIEAPTPNFKPIEVKTSSGKKVTKPDPKKPKPKRGGKHTVERVPWLKGKNKLQVPRNR